MRCKLRLHCARLYAVNVVDLQSKFTNCISIRCCNILQSVRTSSVAACRNAWGGKNSLRSNIMTPVSKHCLAARCASQRCPLDKLLMLTAKSQTSLDFARLHVTFRPWRGITFCNEQARRIVILNTAPLDFAGEPPALTFDLSPCLVACRGWVCPPDKVYSVYPKDKRRKGKVMVE